MNQAFRCWLLQAILLFLNISYTHSQTLKTGVNYLNSSSASSAEDDAVIRIMPLGNSITFGNNSNLKIPDGIGLMKSYRQKLGQLLNDNGYPLDFVGSEHTGEDVSPAFDGDNAGFSAIEKGELLSLLKTGVNPRNSKKVSEGPYLDAYKPAIILLHIGTNAPSPNTTDIAGILDEVDDYEARTGIKAVVVLAQIIKRLPEYEGDERPKNLTDYNDALALLAEERINNGDNIILVDMENGAGINYVIGEDLADGLHPNESGFEKMAAKWFEALQAVLGNVPTAPSELTAEAVSETSAQLSWKDNSNDEINMALERSASPGADFSPMADLPPNTVSYLDEGLQPGQTVYYRLKVANDLFESGYSNTASATTFNKKFAAPSELQANALSETAIEIHWTDNTDTENGFVLESSATSGEGFTELAVLDADAIHFTHEGLAPEQTIFYRVKAINGVEASAYSNEGSATTLITGMEDYNFSKSLNVFPNPAHAFLHLVIDNEKLGKFEVRVINIMGGELRHYPIEKNERVLRASFDLQGLRRGIYLMEITHAGFRDARLLSIQ